MTRTAMPDFRWVHAIGGREEAARYLVGLGFGTENVAQMQKRLSHWTNANGGKGQMAGNAMRAMAEDRGIKPGDLDVLTPADYAASLQKQDQAA